MDGLVVEPMGEEFILWRCLHGRTSDKAAVLSMSIMDRSFDSADGN